MVEGTQSQTGGENPEREIHSITGQKSGDPKARRRSEEAVRPEKEINYGTVDLIPNEGTLALDYATKTQIVSLNVRKFESEYGFEGSRGIEGCLRLFPHRLEGEGHFVALLEKRTEKPDANVKDLENAGEKALSAPLLEIGRAHV